MAGKFITIEGPDGSGKTTITDEMERRLMEAGVDFVRTREPGGIDIAESIRSIILNPEHTAMDARTEALLYAASRRQHLVEKVIPAVEANKLVLCERFIDSSLAYQGHGRGLGIDAVLQLNQFAIEDRMPDVTIFIDVTPEVGLERIKRTRVDRDRLDMETMAFHKRVYEGYQIVKERFKQRIQVIDGTKPLDQVIDDVYQIIMKAIKD